jgi:hypothetical protein
MACPLGGMRLAPAAADPESHHPHPRQRRQVPGIIEKLRWFLFSRETVEISDLDN